MTAIVEKVETRGRKAIFADKFAIVDALKAIEAGTFENRYLAAKLVDLGLVEKVFVKTEGRGRPGITFKVSGRGRSRIALAKTWKR